MASANLFRPRLPASVQAQVRAAALRSGLSEDEAVKAAIAKGLQQMGASRTTTPAPEQISLREMIQMVERAQGDAARLAAAAAVHCADRDVRGVPELHGFIAAIGQSMSDVANNIAQAIAKLPERHRAA
jgi:hypothetical protein